MASLNKQGSYIARVALANMLGENNDGLHITVMLSGQHGIGKSMIVKQAAKKLNGTEFVIECSQVGEGVLTGLPFAMEDKASGLSEVRFVKYYVFNRLYTIQKKIWEKATTTGFLGGRLKMDADTKVVRYTTPDGKVEVYNTIDDNGVDIDGEDNKYKFGDNLPSKIRKELLESGEIHPVIVLMDEINRADMQAQKECMNIILNRCVNGYQLPWWVEIVAAMNPSSQSSSYAVNEMDPAQLDRFFKLDIAPTSTDFIAYAKEKDFAPLIPDFIKENRTALYQQKDLSNTECVPEPTPRGYEMLDLIFKGLDKLSPMFLPEEMTMKVILEDLSELCMSKLGKTTGTLFFDYVKNTLYNVTLDQFLNDDNELSHTKDKLKLMKSDMAESLGVNIISYLKDFAGSLSTNWRKLFELESKIGIFIKTIDKKTRIVFAHQFEDATTRQNQSFVSTYHDIYYHVIQPVFSQEKELKASYKKLK